MNDILLYLDGLDYGEERARRHKVISKWLPTGGDFNIDRMWRSSTTSEQTHFKRLIK